MTAFSSSGNCKRRAQMASGVCALCQKEGELRNSHIIPDAYFRGMKREGSGSLVAVDDINETLVRRSIESWSEYLLCDCCEKRFSRWETQCIRSLRQTAKVFERAGNSGAPIQNYSYATLRLFLLSILWRAGVSTQQQFTRIQLPPECLESLRLSLYLDEPLQPFKFNCRVRKIFDKSGKFSSSSLECVLLSPAQYLTGNRTVCTFIFGGYEVEYYIPTSSLKQIRELGMVRDKLNCFVPPVDMRALPSLMNLFRAGLNKARAGMVDF
jgi:hypothetical protein